MSNKVTKFNWSGVYGNFTGLKVPVTAKAASYTVTAAESGAVFHTTGATGAVTYTLPVPTAGLNYTFVNTVAQNMIIASGTVDKLVGVNDAAADSIEFSTASEQIGAVCQMWSDGLLWFASTPNSNTVTLNT